VTALKSATPVVALPRSEVKSGVIGRLPPPALAVVLATRIGAVDHRVGRKREDVRAGAAQEPVAGKSSSRRYSRPPRSRLNNST
jgi:hypothetical protein